MFASCDSSTDVEWLDANLPFETRAQYVCANLSGSICLASEVTLDPAQINIGSNDPEDRKKSACHEAGHSVDLQHGDNKTDCRGAVRPSGVREDGSDRARGIFFVEDRTLEPYLDFIIDEGLGRPADASVTATHVQGFLIEDQDGVLVSVYESLSAMPEAWQQFKSLADVRESLG